MGEGRVKMKCIDCKIEMDKYNAYYGCECEGYECEPYWRCPKCKVEVEDE